MNNELEFNIEDEVKDPTPQETPEVNPALEAHFNIIKEAGYLNLPEDYTFDGDLQKAYELDYQIRSQAAREDLISSLPKDLQDIIEYGLEGGKDVDGYLKLKTTKLELDLNNEAEVEKFVKSHYKNKGLPDKVIKSYIEDLKDEATLVNEAKNIQKEYEASVKQSLEAKRQADIEAHKESLKEQKEFADKVQSTIDSSSYTLPIKQKIVSELATGQLSAKLEKIFKQPESLVKLTELLMMYDGEKFDTTRLEDLYSSRSNQKQRTKFDEILDAHLLKQSGKQTSQTRQIDYTKLNIDIPYGD